MDGYRVPYLQVIKYVAPEHDGLLSLNVDERFSIDFLEEELDKWAWIIANGMAVAAGYSCHGENSQPLNRFKCAVHMLGELPS